MNNQELIFSIKEIFQNEIKLLRAEMQIGFDNLRKEMNAGFLEIRKEMDIRFSEVKTDINILKKDIRNLQEDMEYVKSAVDAHNELLYKDVLYKSELKRFAEENKLSYSFK